MANAIHDLNDEMRVAGVRNMAMGIRPIDEAVALIQGESGEIDEVGGRYLRGEEHMSGFWILECKDLREATEWGKKAVVACRANVEIRQFYRN